jgi:hypothetical protein|tara:strand:+ start:272 stop:508 length:237 start_codon:yes stop_codon:yes gene_type:complete
MGGSPARAVKRIISPPKPPAPPTPAPTTAEVSQATATSMDGYDARKTKAKGRSMTILTGPRGVEDQTVTLGRPSILGT